MQIKINFLCRDSILAAPIVADLALFTDLAQRTRSDDGVVREFRSGGFLMAIRNGIPILPVTVNGSWRIMPDKHSMSFSPGPIQIVVGKPIDTSEYTRKTMKDLVERTRDAVVANLEPDYPKS